MKHFTPQEFRCPCGECARGYRDMQVRLLALLDQARAHAGIPFTVTSSIRCEAWNELVGGVDSSAHLRGWAVDIAANTGDKRWRILDAARAVGFDRIGVARTFVHLDCDPTKAARVLWTY